jgi:hypothetical protein
MSRGYFDWVPEATGQGFLRIAVQMEIDSSKLKTGMRKALRKALDTGILPSYSGHLAALYRTIGAHYGWDNKKTHMWTNSCVIGCRFYVSEQVFDTKIAPFLAVLAPKDIGPRYDPYEGFGTLAKSIGPNPSAAEKYRKRIWAASDDRRMVGKVTPDNIIAVLKEYDHRPAEQVQEVLELLDQRERIYCKQLINP